MGFSAVRGRVYLDDGRSLNYQEAGGAFHGRPGAGRLHLRRHPLGRPNAQWRAERLAGHVPGAGWSRHAGGARGAGGVLAPTRVLRGGTPLVFQVEPVANSTWSVVTVRRPQVDLGTSWSLVLE